jgi:hypothetical protein
VFEGHGLVTVERGYSELEERVFDGRRKWRRKLSQDRWLRWEFGMMSNFEIPQPIIQKPVQKALNHFKIRLRVTDIGQFIVNA